MVANTMNSKLHERPHSQDEAEVREETPASRPSSDTTRTSGSGGRSCWVCGRPITGRRRNGCCSDRCRLRAGRAAKRKRLELALANLERKVETFGGEMRSAIDSLRTELLADDGRDERDPHPGDGA